MSNDLNNNEKTKKITLTVAVMVAATVIAKLLGLVRDMLVAAGYGTGAEATAYETATRLPVLLYDFVIGGVITAAFIPVFSEIRSRRSKEEALHYASDYFNLIFSLTAILMIAGEILAPVLVRLLAPGLADDVLALAASLTRIVFPMVVFAGAAFCMVGVLQCFGQFRLPAVISVFSNGAIVLYLLFFNRRFGVYGLAAAFLAGWLLQFAVQIPAASKFGFRFRAGIRFSPELKQSCRMFLPVLLSSWLLPVSSIINMHFASGMSGGGAVTAIGYANRFYTIIAGIFSFIATNLLFPAISGKAADGDAESARRTAASSLKMLLTAVTPAACGCFALALPLVRMVYMRGEFNENDAMITASALRWFSVGMPAFAINEVLTKLYFSRKAPKIPMISSVAASLFDVLCVYILSGLLGIAGIALSTGIAVTLAASVNWAADARAYGSLLGKKDVFEMIRVLLFSAATGIAAYAVMSFTADLMGETLSLICSVAAGCVVYLALTWFFPCRELGEVMHRRKDR